MSAEHDHRRSITVLVVEDEWLVRDNLVSHLQSADCQVVEAASGEAAVELLQQGVGIDVVVTDIRLGGRLNGWDVGEVSRAKNPDVPVIYASAVVIAPERPVPGSVFFRKPYDPEQVLKACRKLATPGKVEP